MKGATRSNLALALLSAALWSALWFTSAEQQTTQLLQLDKALRIRIDTPTASTSFERDACGWIRAGADPKRALAPALERLAGLASARVLKRYPRGDLDDTRLGLTPRRAIHLNGQRVEFGGLEPINGWRYVRLTDGSVVLIVDRYSDLFKAELLDSSQPLACPDA